MNFCIMLVCSARVSPLVTTHLADRERRAGRMRRREIGWVRRLYPYNPARSLQCGCRRRWADQGDARLRRA
eukprot:1029177-Prymnesium_polylepis.1